MRLRISKQIPRRTSRTPMSLNCYEASGYTHLEDINYNVGLLQEGGELGEDAPND